MADLIDRDELFHGQVILVGTEDARESVQGVMDAIWNAPTVDAEPVRHGRWILHRLGDEYFKCSVCGYQQKAYAMSLHFKYCTNCGAKMDGGDGNAISVEG